MPSGVGAAVGFPGTGANVGGPVAEVATGPLVGTMEGLDEKTTEPRLLALSSSPFALKTNTRTIPPKTAIPTTIDVC